MPDHPPSCSRELPARPAFELAEVFRRHGDVYQRCHALTPEQGRAIRDVARCRTPALGGHLDECDTCGFSRPAYNSCRNRHCPKCQGAAQAAWVQKHLVRVLETHYFHVVFTLPAELRPLVHDNRRVLFGLLFETAPQALLELGQDRLGATLGITAVLHTWTRDLSFHPHLHMVVTGGGLARAGDAWLPTRQSYLFPYRVLSRLFRGKFLAGLARLYHQRRLKLRGDCEVLADPTVFRLFKDRLYSKDWNVYQKPPFGGPDQVYRYLGRYTHRIALSNRRIVALDSTTARIKTKHGRTATLRHSELIRRFLLHVLPKGFVRIRHYGLLATRAAAKLDKARAQLEDVQPAPDQTPSAQHTTELNAELPSCPACLIGVLIPRPLVPLSTRSARPPPGVTP